MPVSAGIVDGCSSAPIGFSMKADRRAATSCARLVEDGMAAVDGASSGIRRRRACTPTTWKSARAMAVPRPGGWLARKITSVRSGCPTVQVGHPHSRHHGDLPVICPNGGAFGRRIVGIFLPVRASLSIQSPP